MTYLAHQFLATSDFSETSCSKLLPEVKWCGTLLLITAILCHVPSRIGSITHHINFNDNHNHAIHCRLSLLSSKQLGTAK